jgi:Flp pilus assembly protein CpaB
VLATLGAVLLRIALSPYGPPTTVLITTVELAAGTAPSASDVTTERWPRALLPSAPPATRADLDGSRLTMGVTAGSVLTLAHLRDDGPLAALTPGSAAVPVPVGTLRGVRSGSLVDLVGVAGDGSGRTIAREARVLTVDGDTVWLEVARDRAADVAAAALRGTLSGAVLAE